MAQCKQVDTDYWFHDDIKQVIADYETQQRERDERRAREEEAYDPREMNNE